MFSGPVLARELLTTARRGKLFRQRVMVVAAMFAILWICFYSWSVARGRVIQAREIANFALTMFAFLVLLQIVLTLVFVPEPITRGIAGERERRTLSYLLATPMTSAEIVLDKVGAGLVQYVSGLAVGLPIAILLVFLGGVDPIVVLLTYVGFLSTAFVLAGFSALIAVNRRTSRESFGVVVGISAAWLTLPIPGTFLISRMWSWLSVWLAPLNVWLLASNPFGVMIGWLRLRSASAFVDSIAWMIGLQVSAGLVFLLGAIVLLRPASRTLEGGEVRVIFGKKRFRPVWHWRMWPKPPCGDDPMLWKEMYTSRIDGITKIVNVVVYAALTVAIGYGVYYFGMPALREMLSEGYQSDTDNHRVTFNQCLRITNGIITLMVVILVSSTAAEGLGLEKSRDTWTSLLATPLPGREILRAKALGAIWRVRWGIVLVVILGAAGMLTGAVHPVGYFLSLTVLTAFVAFHAALGMFISLYTKDMRHAASWTALLSLITVFSPISFAMPVASKPILMAAGSCPFLASAALISCRNMRELRFSGLSSAVILPGMPTEEPVWQIFGTFVIAILGAALAAIVMSWIAFRQFDRIVGRPRRAREKDQAAHDNTPEASGRAQLQTVASVSPPVSSAR